MKPTRILLMIVLWLSGSMLFNTCQYDEFDDRSLISGEENYVSEEVVFRESALPVVNNQPACIDPDDPVYVENTQQENALWGNPKTPFVKTVDVGYYNTLTHFVLKVKSTHGWANLVIGGESVWVDGPVGENTWGEYSVELPEHWEAGDAYTFGLQVTGFGPPAYFDVEYYLIGECEDDDWPRDTQTLVVEVTNPGTGKTWMDRNLGASRAATSSDDAEAYGDLYQWGRAADGHQIRTSGTTTTLSNTDQPGHGNFITTSSTPHDWRSPKNDNLWQGTNGINNPCPTGYRLPTEAEWEAENRELEQRQ